jgi:tetraacyldisaccharide 4'-kinase
VPDTSFESRLTQAWLQRGLLARLLWPLSLLFGLLAAFRRALYALHLRHAARLPVPVIVVGNIFVGGTGKTPLTIWLVEALRRAGYTPGVISRGYGSGSGNGRGGVQTPRAVIIGGDPALYGDEPMLIAEQAHCPVMVGRRRVDAGRALLLVHPEVDVIISDDGLQHYALARDIEIVLSDSRGIGNGWLLPAGPLREPVSRRRDFTVANLSGGAGVGAHADVVAADAGPVQGGFGMTIAGDDAWQLRDPGCRRALHDFAEYTDSDGLRQPNRIVAAAGIGNPSRFFATLRQAGLQLTEMPLPDHYRFSENPFEALDADVILITSKDAVKCRAIESIRNDQRIWVVPVTAHLDGPLAEHIVEKLRERPTA